MTRTRIVALALSASGLVGIVAHEGYTDKAVIPVQGDRPTVGFGSTYRDDGSPVQMGDSITPARALARTQKHIQKDENELKACVTGELNQTEYDVLVDFAYQYGVATACKSSMVRHLNNGDYEQSCRSYVLYKFAGRYDCSTPGNTRCPGVHKRNLERQARCLAAR